MERDEAGRPKPPRDEGGRPLTGREIHRIQLFHAGIHDPETVAKLWRERKGR